MHRLRALALVAFSLGGCARIGEERGREYQRCMYSDSSHIRTARTNREIFRRRACLCTSREPIGGGTSQDRNSGVYLNRPPDAAPGDSRRKHAAGVIFRTPHSALASTQKCSCPTPHCTLQVLDLISESLFVAPPVSSPWAPRCAALGRAVRWFCDDVTDVIRHVGCIERSLATLAERHTRYMVPESRTMMV